MPRTTARSPPWTALWLTSLSLLFVVAQSQNANASLTLELTSRTGGALYVQWTATNTTDNISNYGVLVNGSLVANVPAWVTTYSAYGLVADTLYNVTVQGNLLAADANGSMVITSNPLLIKTLNATTPDMPGAVELVAAGGGFLRVRVPLPQDTGGVNLSTIVLTTRSQVDLSWLTYSSVASEPEFTLYGLMAKTTYRVRAYVANDAGLSSPQSYAVYLDTAQAQNPGPCPAPTVLNVTGGSIGVQLNPPVDAGGAQIRGYVVYMAVNGSGVFDEVANTVLTDEFYAVDIRRLPGQPTKPLMPRMQYDIKAVAVNMVEMCVNPSTVGNLTGNVATAWTTDASLPEAPPQPYFLSATGGHISIQLLMPGNMRGAQLTGFSIMVNESVYGFITANGERAFDILPLLSLSNYSIQVAVTTDIGVSDWSPEVIMSTSSSSAPSVPTNVSVTDISSSQATIRWTPPLNSGGIAISDYRLVILSSRGSQTVLTGGAATYRLNTLLANSAYTVKVVAINSAGRESTTTRIQGVTFQTLAPTAPGEPRGVRSVSSTGGVLEIAWQAPEVSGGMRFEDLLYNATLFPVGSCFNSSSSNQSVCQACNLVRVPASSEQYNITYGGQYCVQPSIPACPDGTSGCCVTPSNGSFESGLLCSRIAGQGRSRIVSDGSTLTSFERLNPSSTYYAGVEAVNALGRSKMSPIMALQTRAQTAPGYPSNIRQMNATGGSVVISWSPPLDTGGTTIIGYNVYRDYRRLTSSPVYPPFADCGLVANSQYVYGISAVNASRIEGAMGSILVTTPQVTLPAPITLSLAARTVSWMNVTVLTSCDTSGSSALSYQYVVRANTTFIASGFFACCSFLIPGLDAGLSYNVSVRVANEAGSLGGVTSTSSTTSGVPSTPQWQLQRSNSYSLVFSTMSATNPDQEIVSYDIVVYQNGVVIHEETIYCDTFIGSGLWSCPETYRLGGLIPHMDYNLSTRAIGVRGASAWSMNNFSTSDEAAGVFKIVTQDYSASSGDTVNVTVQRMNGTAGPANVTIDVLQPDSVVLRCDCQASIGCACGLHLQVSGTLTSPGILQFLDGQENQTVQVSVWEDDDSAPQSLAVLLNLIGANVVTGTPSQALIRVTPSQRGGFPCFISSKFEVFENASQLKVNVIRVKGSSGPLSFDVQTFDISSTAFKHYLPLSTTVTMSDRQSLASFSIRLIDNSYYDGTRVFGIRLLDRNITSAARAILQQSVITRRVMIVDDEDPSMVLPGTPQGITLARRTGGELDFSWVAPNSSNGSVAGVGGYVFRASTPSNGTQVSSMFNISAMPTFILSSLESRTLYQVQVAAWNMYGMSEFSSPFLAMTTSPTPPSEPEDFRVLVAGSSRLMLTWSAPRDTGGGDVTKYVISLRAEDNIFRPLVSLPVPVTTYVVQSLSALTEYFFVIAAATDAFPVASDGSSSEYPSAYLAARTSDPTVAAKPPPPDLMRPAAGGSLTFLIREPEDLGGLPISDYSLYLRKAPTFDDDGALVNGSVPVDEPFRVVCSDATPWANDSYARSCTVYKLLAATNYEAYVVLHNDMGSSPPSDRTILRTKSTIDLPSPPENFGPSRVTAGNIYLSWELPVDLGGAADVLGYTVFQKTDVYFSNDFFIVYDGRDSTTRELAVKGLTRNTPYAFAVVAQNAASYCVNLAAQQVSQFLPVMTLSYSQISPPQSLRQGSASGGMIRILWDDPDDLAGIYLSGYTVELIVDGDGVSAQSVTLGSLAGYTKTFSHSGLVELTTYRYAVRAFNQDGPSERSEIMAFTTTACTAPTNVLNTQFTGGSGGRVAISWQPPEDTGGRPIIYYQVTRTDRPDAIYTTASLYFTDTNGLTANSQYVYLVRAFNELFMGDSSYVWTSTGNPSLPESAVLTAVASFGGRIEVNWTSPQDTGGIPIVAFVVTLLDATGENVIESYRGVDPSHTFTSLNATSAYQLSLQAVNDVGPGPRGNYSVYTGPVDLPSDPPAPIASEILGGSMNVTVYPPTYNGGDVVTLSLHNGSSVLYTFAEGETSVAVKSLVALTTYRFHVIASNSRGDTSGETLVVSTGAISQPSNVESVQLVGTSFDRLIVAWPAVQDTGGDIFLKYVVSYFQCDDTGAILSTSQVVQVTTPSLNATLLQLEHTSNYSVSVHAVTSSGLIGATSPSAVFATEEPFQGRITVQFAEVAVREDATVVSIDVLRVEGSFGDIVYSFSTVDETALAGINYEAASGTLTMGSGVKTAAIDIILTNDATYDPNTTFLVLITDGPTGRQTETRVVLLDDGDAGFISFAQPQFAFPENSGTVHLPISRYGGSSPYAMIEVFIVTTQSALENRFTLPEQVVTFNDGDAQYDLPIVFQDDSTFQFWPDSITLGFRILLGGVWAGDYTSANVTALDDGDISPAKEITNLKLLAATGGSVQLEWSPPVDRGGTDVTLSYSVGFATTLNDVILNVSTATNYIVMYNLNASTPYQVVVFAINPAGLGLGANPALISTTKATPPTAPLNVIVIAASSSSLLLTWDPPLDAGGSPVIGYKIYNVSNNGTAALFPTVSCTTPNICSIQRLVALTYYSIQVRAFTVSVSAGGVPSDDVAFQTSNPDVPDPPPVANVTWFSAGAMTIKMFKPINVGGSDVEMYRLFIRGALDDDFTQQYEGIADSFTVYRLERRTTYEIKYQVINTVGASAFGASAFQQTLERSLPSAPINLVSVSATGGSITLSWQEPLDVGGRPISGYTVFVKPTTQTNVTSAVADEVGYDGKGNPATQGIVYGLNASTTYSMYVIAYSEVSNCYSPTELAASSTAQLTTTVATLPVPAPTLLLVRYTGGIVELMWTPPIDTGGVPIDSYTLSLVSPTGTVPIFTTPGSSRLSFIHNDLIESTVYTYMVKANTTVGDSPMSDPVVVKTLIATAPSAPVNLLQLSYVTGGAIQIGWTRPLDTGGQPLKGYWVYRDGVPVAQNLPANTSNFTDKQSLRATTSYQYTIRAFSWSTMGSELSAQLTAKTTTATRPQLPALITNLTGASFIQVNWAADPDTGGMPVSLFDVKLLQGPTVAGTFTGTDTSFRFTRLLALTSYTLQIVAYSQIGASDMLSTVFTTLNVTLPAPPVAPLALSVFGGNMTIEVSAPVDTGGAPVSELRLYEAKLGMLGSSSLVAGALKAQFPVYGVLKLTSYAITARAVNVLGEGGSSPVLTVQTGTANMPGSIRSAPTLTGATGSTLSVAWTAPVDTGGDATLSYEVRFLENGTNTSITSLSASRTLQGTGLKFLTTYIVSVRAINTAGKSDWSLSRMAKTLPDAAGEFNFQATAVNVSESAGGVVLTVTRTNGLSGSVTVSFSVSSSGSNAATLGKDYALVSGSATTTSATLTFSALQVSASMPIQIINDDVYEAPDEQFTVRLTAAKVVGTSLVIPPSIGVNSTTVVTILDDGDAGYVGFAYQFYPVREDGVWLDIPVLRQGGKSGLIVLSVVLADGTATGDRDYRRAPGLTVSMVDGQTNATVRVFIINDKTYEYPDEIFTVQVVPLSGGALLRNPVTTVVIIDDGDLSVAAAPSTPVVLGTSGGGVTMGIGLPAHNGSAKGQLIGYVVRILNPATSDQYFNTTVALGSTATVGWLTAQTSYGASVAAINAAGLGPFSAAVWFTTTVPTLPAPVMSISQTGSTGGSLSLKWVAPSDTGGVPITKYRIYYISSQNVPKLVLEIPFPLLKGYVLGLNALTTYRFAVQAGNDVLEPELAHGWGVIGPPFSFTTPAATLAAATTISKDPYLPSTGGSITIQWNAPIDTGGVPLVRYDVYARNATTGFRLSAQAMQPVSQSVRIEELYASSWYEIFVLSINNVSQTVLPGHFSCSRGSSSLVTSQDVTKNVSSGAVIRAAEGVFVVGDMTRATKGTLPLTAAYMGSSVSKVLAAVIGAATSFANLSTTQPSIPRVPPKVTLINATGGAISFQVESPGDTGGVPIDDFTVLVDGVQPEDDVVQKRSNMSSMLKRTMVMRVSNLEPLADHEITAVAVNSISLCDFNRKDTSEPAIFQTTNISQPEPPRIATQSVSGGGMVLALLDPFDKGGSPITRYQLYMATDLTKGDWTRIYVAYAANDSTVTRQSATVASLKPLTKYFFMLSVNNGFLESLNSSVATIATSSISPPGQCTEPRLVAASGGMLSIAWDDPLDNGGAPVIDFLITLQRSGSGAAASKRTINSWKTRNYTFYGLTDETDYVVAIRARNLKGLGVEGIAATLSTTEGSPPLGAIGVTVLSSTGGAAIISFNEPVDFGGTPRESMVYSVFVEGVLMRTLKYADLAAVVSTSTTKSRRLTSANGISIGGLDPLGLFSIQIQPMNDFDSGSVSQPSLAATTAPTLPSAPQSLTASTVTGGSIQLKWKAPSDSGGLPLAEYVVYMSANNQTGPFDVSCRETITGCRVSSLTAATSYWFYVTASNALGESPATSVLNVATASISIPSAAGKVRVVSVSENTIEVTWSPPLDTGGANITTYTVAVNDMTLGGALTPLTTSTPSATISGLSPTTEYSITVTATNQLQRVSAESMPQIVTTASAVNTPAEPIVSCVSPTTVSLSWYPYPGATEYRVYKDGTEVYSGNATDMIDSNGLTSGTDYTYTLEALINGAWSGTTSLPVVAHTSDDPSSTETTCSSTRGHIQQTSYEPNVDKSWLVAATTVFETLTIEFMSFDLECDHDYLSIENANDDTILWQGGCQRSGTFVYQSKTPVRLRLHSDASVQKSGFDLYFETDRLRVEDVPTRIASPQAANGAVCSSHGIRQNAGSCRCSVGFTGEACNNYIVCCSDAARCSNPVCSRDPSQVIVVSDEFGNDAYGTGEMMDTSDAGKSSKAVKTLSKALSLAKDGDLVFVYPGEYKGALNRELTIDSRNDLTIESLKGFAWTTINCEGAGRGMQLTSSSVIVQGFTIRNGSVTVADSDGGSIVATDSNLTLQDVLLTQSSATRSGGAISGIRSNVTAIATSVEKSNATSGGGVSLVDSQLLLSQSNVTMCTATNGAGLLTEGSSGVSGGESAVILKNLASVDGGGVLVRSGALTLRNLTIAVNEAARGGGVLAQDNSAVVLDRCRVLENEASTDGGGMAIVGTVTVSGNDTTFEDNSAVGDGGAVHVRGQVSMAFDVSETGGIQARLQNNRAGSGSGLCVVDSTLVLSGLSIQNGTSSGNGGGICVDDSQVTLTNVSVSSNVAASMGGGVFAAYSEIVSQGAVVVDLNNASAHGGGLFLSSTNVGGDVHLLQNMAAQRGGGFHANGTSTLVNLTVEACSADQGGGGYLQQATVTATNVTVTDCTATTFGGGLYMNGSSLSVFRSVVNRGSAIFGGGVCAVNGSRIAGDLVISRSIASENGGALYATDQLTLSSIVVTNSAAKRGAGLYTESAVVTATDVAVSSCYATLEGGGWSASSSSLTLTNVRLEDSTSDDVGGAMALTNCSIAHNNITLVDNQAKTGGGLYLVATAFTGTPLSPDATAYTSTIANNTAQDHGGNVYVEGRVTMSALLLTGGSSGISGGGVALRQANASISQCVIQGNAADVRGGGLSLRDQSSCDLGISLVNQNTAKTSGGAVSVEDSVFTHNNLELHENRALNGGGFALAGVSSIRQYVGSDGSLLNASQAMQLPDVMGNGSAFNVAPQSVVDITGLYVYQGLAGTGGLFVDTATVTVERCQFVYNNATVGGALFANPQSTVSVVSSQFYSNRGDKSGGAVQLTGNSDANAVASFVDCEFTDNYAEQVGGAVAVAFADLTLLRTRFQTNTIGSNDGGGGAIGATTQGELNITDCAFGNNTVQSENAKGGSLYLLADTNATITRTALISDKSSILVREGGVVYVGGKGSELAMVDCEIAYGQSYSGGSIFVQEATLSLVRTVLREGYAYEFGGSVYMDSGVAEIADCDINDNDAFYDGGGIYMKGKSTLSIRNTTIENNRVQDGGAGLYVAPGGGASVKISDSSFVMNRNRGLGSAIYVGRKNTLTMATSELLGNGGANTEGGSLYAVDAQVTVSLSTFLGNRAVRGAAIELSRDAQLTMTNSDFADNQATVWGGAIYMSVRAIATIEDSSFRNNSAVTGGVAYLLGSSKLTLRRSNVTANIGLSFGGALTLIGRARAEIDRSVLTLNRAYTGGAISVTQNAALVLTSSQLSGNTANDFGGGLYIDTLTTTASQSIQVQSVSTRDNAARAGVDVYWVYHAWYEFSCASCASSSSSSGKIRVATSPALITAGWWPSTVTSGVSLGITKPSWKSPEATPTPASTNATTTPTTSPGIGPVSGPPAAPPAPGNRRLTGSSSSSSSSDSTGTMDAMTLASIIANPDLTSPFEGTLWPTIVVKDFYGAIADQDNRTRCVATKLLNETDDFDFYPASSVDVERGYVTFTDGQVLSESRPTPFGVFVSCSLADDTARNLTVQIVVDNCNPGYENVEGRCVPCKKGTYSLDGVKCHLCPLGATCEKMDATKTVIGVSVPTRTEGYFLYDSRGSYLDANCLDASKWDDGDPCKRLVNVSEQVTRNMTYRLQHCSKNPTFDKYWSRKRVFACLAGLEYYACDTRDACIAEGASTSSTTTTVQAMSTSTIAQVPSLTASTNAKQCDVGYNSVTCATCISSFYKVSNGKCKPCSDPHDPAVERMTRLVALVPVGFAVAAAILVWFYFTNSSEREIMKQARAARKFQIYDPHSRPQSLLLAAKFFVQQRVDEMIQRARTSLERRRRVQNLFGIERRKVTIPAFRAEKFKILLAFFQIFGGFKKLYEIPWPNEMSRLMDIFTIADFSIVDTTGIECFIHKDYFSNYRLSLIAVIVLLFMTTLLLSWGVVRYRVKLAGLPRHCVRCGLPVFQMLKQQPKTLVRRSTMVSMLRIERKMHADRMRRRSFVSRAKDNVVSRADEWISRVKSWWTNTRLGKIVERFIVFTRLPASCSEHHPSCPTSQEIESEVLAMVVRSNLRLWRARIRLRLNYQSFQNKCIKLFFWILLLFYPELSQRVVGMFYCDEIGSYFYMSRDKSQLCYEGMWLYYLPLTMFLLVVWVAGVPLLFWTIIFVKRRSGVEDQLLLLQDSSHAQLKQRFLKEMREDLIERGIHLEPDKFKAFEKEMLAEFLRNKKLNEPSMVAQVGFIYHSYRSQFWWFEVWDLCRKLFLNCVIGLLAKTGANRIIAGLIVFLIYLSVMLFYQPYKDRSDSALAGVTQIQLFITLFCGLMLKMGALHMEDSVVSLLTYVAFFSNVLTMIFAVCSILYEKFDGARRARRRAREDHRRAIQSHVRKLWRMAYGYAFTEVYLRDPSIRPMPIQVFLELARRDREAKKEREMELQLARSLQVRDNEDDDGPLSSSQVEFDLPRPRDVVSPRAASALSSSASFKQEKGEELEPSRAIEATVENAGDEDNQTAEMPFTEDSQQLGDEGGDAVAGAVDM